MDYESLKSYEAETALIGAALLRGAEILEDPAVSRLIPAHFTDDRTIDTWAEILRQKSCFDLITIRAAIESTSSHVDNCWLSECIQHCGNAYFAAQYGNLIWTLARKRRVYQIVSGLGASLFKDTFEQELAKSIISLSRVMEAKN